MSAHKFSPLPKNPRFIDLSGQRFNRLKVLGFHGDKNGRKFWVCRCDCGTEKVLEAGSFKYGNTQSCGCMRRDIFDKILKQSIEKGLRTESGNVSPEYKSFSHAKARCQCKTDPKYPLYGARGIKFEFIDFQHFISTLGKRPSPNHSIDRIDVNGHYSPENCRWATPTQQSRNIRDNVTVEIEGVEYKLASFFKSSKCIQYRRSAQRIRNGWKPIPAIFYQGEEGQKPKRSTVYQEMDGLTMAEAIEKYGHPINRKAVHSYFRSI